MYRNLVGIIVALLLTVASNAKEKDIIFLTTEQKLADFDSLYHQLNEVFPYFEINKRKNGIDWLGNYEMYREEVKQTKNNKEFFVKIEAIVDQLNSGHADLWPNKEYDYFLTAYRLGNMMTLGAYRAYVQELKKNDARHKYKQWQAFYKELHTRHAEVKGDKKEVQNVQFEFCRDSSIAIIKIKSFGVEHIKKDKKAILAFCNQLKNYDNLIIDVQGNGGGYTGYWQDMLVPYLSNNNIEYTLNMVYKDSPAVYKFVGSDKSGESLLPDSLHFPNLPPEARQGNYYFASADYDVKSEKKSVHYKGNIFLLVDHGVFSSTETLAYFCKTTGFAKVAGEQSGGDGIGADPFLYTLPHSGIVMRYPGIMGLNQDGSSNDEFGTTPDIEISATTKAERLKKLKAYIFDSSEF